MEPGDNLGMAEAVRSDPVATNLVTALDEVVSSGAGGVLDLDVDRQSVGLPGPEAVPGWVRRVHTGCHGRSRRGEGRAWPDGCVFVAAE